MSIHLALTQDPKRLLNIVDLSIIIPAFNLENRIVIQVQKLKTIFNSSLCENIQYEIIIINDGSVDKTLDLLKEVAQTDSHIKLISYGQNMGKGYAVREGILKSTGKLTMLLDGDCEISLDSLNDYLNGMQDWDLLIGSKMHPLSTVELPLFRRFLSRAFNALVRCTLDIKVKDTQVGLKVANGILIREIFNHIRVNRYAFDVELLTIATLLGLKIKEMPVDITVKSHFKTKEMAKMFLDVLSIVYRYRILRSYKLSALSEGLQYLESENIMKPTGVSQISQ